MERLLVGVALLADGTTDGRSTMQPAQQNGCPVAPAVPLAQAAARRSRLGRSRHLLFGGHS